MKTNDVLIVGGGIIGGSIAFELARRNLRVTVLDRHEMMREASWAAGTAADTAAEKRRYLEMPWTGPEPVASSIKWLCAGIR